MASVERADIVRALLQKGFREDDRKKHHRYFRLFVQGKRTAIFTKVSHGSGRKYKTLGQNLVTEMAKQLRITRPQLMDFVECKLGGDGYTGLAREALATDGKQL